MMSKETMSNNKNTTRIYASFILRGKELDPHSVTAWLGITPSRSFKRGDKRVEGKEWHHGFWEITSDGIIQSTDLAIHIHWLVSQLESLKPKLIELIEAEKFDAEIRCFWILPGGHDGLILDPSIQKQIAGLGIKLELDIYCDH